MIKPVDAIKRRKEEEEEWWRLIRGPPTCVLLHL